MHFPLTTVPSLILGHCQISFPLTLTLTSDCKPPSWPLSDTSVFYMSVRWNCIYCQVLHLDPGKMITPVTFEHPSHLEGPLMGTFSPASTAMAACVCRSDSRAVTSSHLRSCQGFLTSLQYVACAELQSFISIGIAIIYTVSIQRKFDHHWRLLDSSNTAWLYYQIVQWNKK